MIQLSSVDNYFVPFFRRRMERERICAMGVPGAWGLSPKAPLHEYVFIFSI